MIRSLTIATASLSLLATASLAQAEQIPLESGQVGHTRLAPVVVHRALPPFKGQHVYVRPEKPLLRPPGLPPVLRREDVRSRARVEKKSDKEVRDDGVQDEESLERYDLGLEESLPWFDFSDTKNSWWK